MHRDHIPTAILPGKRLLRLAAPAKRQSAIELRGGGPEQRLAERLVRVHVLRLQADDLPERIVSARDVEAKGTDNLRLVGEQRASRYLNRGGTLFEQFHPTPPNQILIRGRDRIGKKRTELAGQRFDHTAVTQPAMPTTCVERYAGIAKHVGEQPSRLVGPHIDATLFVR
jgi:hypothetical protein